MAETEQRALRRRTCNRALPGRALALIAIAILAGSSRAAECAGTSLPDSVLADGVVLRLNGVGLREATPLRIDVYVAGLYLTAPERDARRILAKDTPRQMRLQLLRSVSPRDMASNIEAGFRRAARGSFARYRDSLRRLIAAIPPLAAGDRFVLTHLPGRGLRVEHGERLLATLPDADFARTLFAIWIGDPPLSAPLKAGLLGAPCDS